jgi:hypothetical protein
MIRMPDSTRTPPTMGLVDAVFIWRLRAGDVDQVIDAATECLVAGVDSPMLRELAGASPRESQHVLAPMIEETLVELEMSSVLTTSPQRGALTAMLRRFQDDEITARELARWAHTNIGHDGDPDCQAFVDLDDMYDTADYAGRDFAELDRLIAEEAVAFLDGRPSPGRTNVWRNPQEPTAVIGGPKRWRRRFTVRIQPGGREFWARSWDDLWGSLPEMGVPWRNVAFESDDVRDQVQKLWGEHPDAPTG